MRHIAMTALLGVALGACRSTEGVDSDSDEPAPVFPWAAALAPYANCDLEVTYWALHDPSPAGIDRYAFDANGVWTRYEWYDLWYLDGDLGQAIDREIDGLGRELSARYTNGAGETSIETETTWDDVGPVSRTATSPIGMIADRQVTIEHDDQGRVLVEEGLEAPYDGDPVFTYRYEWDEAGRGRGSSGDLWLADRTEIEVDGELSEERSRTFDEEGRWVHLDGVDYQFGPQAWVMDVEYDEAGREVRMVSECTTDCWWWDYQETEYAWTCP